MKGRPWQQYLWIIQDDLGDAARWHNCKTLSWHVNKLRGSIQFGLFPVKERNGATISDKERVKEKWAEHFENMLNQDIVAGKDIEGNDKVCDTSDVKEDLFCEEEIPTVLKGFKNNESPVVGIVVNEFLKLWWL